MAGGQRNPFQEHPEPLIVEMDSVDFDMAWEGADDSSVVCPGCKGETKGHFEERGTSDGRNWVSFAPCGHVATLAEWDVF
jgi:hypothetical protein